MMDALVIVLLFSSVLGSAVGAKQENGKEPSQGPPQRPKSWRRWPPRTNMARAKKWLEKKPKWKPSQGPPQRPKPLRPELDCLPRSEWPRRRCLTCQKLRTLKSFTHFWDCDYCYYHVEYEYYYFTLGLRDKDHPRDDQDRDDSDAGGGPKKRNISGRAGTGDEGVREFRRSVKQ